MSWVITCIGPTPMTWNIRSLLDCRFAEVHDRGSADNCSNTPSAKFRPRGRLLSSPETSSRQNEHTRIFYSKNAYEEVVY